MAYVPVQVLKNRQVRLPREIASAQRRGNEDQAEALRARYERERDELKRRGRG